MEPDQLEKAIAAEVSKQADQITRKAVLETLLQLGADVENPLEMQQDFARLREWRLAVDSVQRKTTVTVVGILVSGLAAAVWLGIKQLLRQE